MNDPYGHQISVLISCRMITVSCVLCKRNFYVLYPVCYDVKITLFVNIMCVCVSCIHLRVFFSSHQLHIIIKCHKMCGYFIELLRLGFTTPNLNVFNYTLFKYIRLLITFCCMVKVMNSDMITGEIRSFST